MPQQKILVADDDELLIGLLSHRLSVKGFEVLTAKTGVEALEAARAERPDLIVLDAMMPVMDGFAVLQNLKADDQTRDLPVVMLTALRDEKNIVSALEDGAEDYLVKPFSPDELVSRINRTLKKLAA
ncbi:response regulator transcription factor [Euryhalocaulis caribicus]|uniref:response regulator transcription factor n=1 Tax=Euryhalocaulis caribicus TaxID=1161401 RepID=UPI00039D6710|nr:response regulator [Euryhalocaulis caribicus]